VLDLALIVVTLLLLRRLLVRPIRQLTDASERIAGGQLSTKIDVQSRDEIGMLAGAINKLQTSLRIAMERMKQRS
jgi:methyl-accepting chemotaxis protein-2 (aspartate sensor receptor)